MDLIGPEMVDIVRPAACRLYPSGHEFSVSPDIVRLRAASGKANKSTAIHDHFSPLAGF